MNTQDLDIFVRLAASGSPADLARQLNSSPRDVLMAIARLEQELDCPLFQRSALRLALNAAGQRYLPHAQTALAALLHGKAALQDSQPQNQTA